MAQFKCSHIALALTAACGLSTAALAQQRDPVVPISELHVATPTHINGVPYAPGNTTRTISDVYNNALGAGVFSLGSPRPSLMGDDASFTTGPYSQAVAGAGPIRTLTGMEFGFRVVQAGAWGPGHANQPFRILINFWDSYTAANPFMANPEPNGALQLDFANGLAAGFYTTGLLTLPTPLVNVTDADAQDFFLLTFKAVNPTTGVQLAADHVTFIFQDNNIFPGASEDVAWGDFNSDGSLDDATEGFYFGGPPNRANIYLRLQGDVTSTDGACCTGLTCAPVADQGACSGVFQGVGSVCTPDPCNPTGACCATDGSCTDISLSDCNNIAGAHFSGAGSTCGVILCASPAPVMGACCNGGSCTIVATGTCNGTYLGNGTLCAPPTGSPANFASADAFPLGIPDGPGPDTAGTPVSTSAASTGAGTVGAVAINLGLTHTYCGDLEIVLSDGTTSVHLVNRPGAGGEPDDYSGGYSFSDGAPVTLDTKAQENAGATLPTGKYKASDAGNLIVLLSNAYNGRARAATWTVTITDWYAADTGTIDSYSVDVTAGGANPCGPVQVRCCFANGSCSMVNVGACVGGTEGSAGSTCSPNTCPQPQIGACCVGAVCTTNVSSNNCNGTFSAGNSCALVAAPPHSFCCPHNYNRDGQKDVADIFAELAGWFTFQPAADWDGNGLFQVGDIFFFIGGWFAPC